MTAQVIFKWLNNDSTADLNKRFSIVFNKGISSGGTIQPVSSTLAVDITPFYAMTDNGLMVTDLDLHRFTIPQNQATVLTIYAKWIQADEPVIEYRAYEISDFNNLLDEEKSDHIVFGTVTVTNGSEVHTNEIDYGLRDTFDKLGRSPFRGFLDSPSSLPSEHNRDGDHYIVGGGGGLIEIYAWNGTAWLNITSTQAIQAELTNHRNNAYTDEKHATDNEKNALLGTTGLPSASNRYVTNQDPRIPAPDQKDALSGSHGTPSSTNKYITQEYPLAITGSLIFPLPPGVLTMIGVGDVYVGKGPVGSANTYFSLMVIGEDTGYINSNGKFPKFTQIYKNNLLTVPLDPSTDADADGFYGGDLYIKVDNVIDTGVRLVYARKTNLKDIDRGYDVIKGPATDFVSGEVRQHIQNIKGRPYGDLLPDDETNKNLREDVDNLISYLGSNQATTIIAADEDYEFFKDDAKLGGKFVKNIGIQPIYTFENTSTVSFNYSTTTGLVTYSGSPDLSNVLVGNLFRDGFDNFFKVVSVNDGTKQVGIVDIGTGLKPLSIISSNATPDDGSIRTNNNPRNLLLSELKGNAHSVIKIGDLYRLQEFSKPEGRPAYGISQADKRINPRVVLYGSWTREPNKTTGEIEIKNISSIGDIQFTGFISSMYLWCKVTPAAPNLEISINNEQVATVVSISQSGEASPEVAYISGERFQKVKIVSGLDSSLLNTINARIQGSTADPLVIYAIETVSINTANPEKNKEINFESGVGFENTRINNKDEITTIPVFPASNRTGSNYTTTLDRDINGVTITNILDTPMSELDFDPNYPIISPQSPTQFSPLNGSEANKLVLFKVGDIVELIGTTKNEKRRLLSITPFLQIDSACLVTEDKEMRLICSLGDNTPDDLAEDYANRYEFVTDFVNHTSTDFNTKNAAPKAQRYVVNSDGATIVGAKNSSISLDRRSVIISQTTGSIDFGVMGTRLDLEFNNPAPVTLRVSIDGSEEYEISVAAGINRKTIFNRSRYTFHEVHIRSLTGEFECTHMTIYSLERGVSKVKPMLTTQDNIAPYRQDFANDEIPFRYSNGKYFMDAFKYSIPTKGAGLNPTWDWEDSPHFIGRILNTQNDGDKMKYTFVGEGFEILYHGRDDGGMATIEVDGVAWDAIPSTTLVGNNNEFLDTYNTTNAPRLASLTGLEYGEHEVVITIPNPRTKNISSSGYEVGIFGLFVLSIDGGLRYTYDSGQSTYVPLVDMREFSSFYKDLIGDSAFPIEIADEVKSAYGLLDGSGTPVNCNIYTFGGKTRVELSFNFVTNANTGFIFGELFVLVDGKILPRLVSGSTPQSYYTEINSNIIELDGDYSVTPFDIQVIKINAPTSIDIPVSNPWLGQKVNVSIDASNSEVINIDPVITDIEYMVVDIKYRDVDTKLYSAGSKISYVIDDVAKTITITNDDVATLDVYLSLKG